jgi:glycosyltransferase involved in cell wall biosynthesis
MRIAVVAPQAVPFAVGGAERLCDGLVQALIERQHDGELVKLPSPEHSFRELVDSYQSFGELDLSHFDLIISTKYPSWMVRHPRHHVYMLHTLRGLYDSYHGFGQPIAVPDTGLAVRRLLRVLRMPPGTADGWREVLDVARATLRQLGDEDPVFGFPGPLIRRLVHWLDRDALDPVNIVRYAAISRTVAERADYFPRQARVDVLLPPTNITQLHAGRYDNFFTASRLDRPKRIELLIKAMDYVQGPTQLRIAGTGPDEQRLRSVRPGDARIVFLGRVSDEQLVQEYADALAVPFVPFDEDFGLVTLEAQLAGKAVITCTDSGGVTELVTDMISGRVVAPEPRALGQAMAEFARSRELARLMGNTGRRAALQVTWDAVVESLIGSVNRDDAPDFPAPPTRRKIVVLCTYPAEPARHGGQIRLNRLVRGLVERFDVDLVTADHGLETTRITYPFPGLRQIEAASGSDYRELEARLAGRVTMPIGDIAATLFAHHSPELVRVTRDATKDAVGVVLEQPYLLPLLKGIAPDLPFVYDSQNAETTMKAAMLVGQEHAEVLLRVVREVEANAVSGAELVGACSTQDREALSGLSPTLADWVIVPNGTDALDTDFVTGDTRAENSRRWLAGFTSMHPDSQVNRLAVFVGSYHPPNLEAAESIVGIAQELPEVCFVIAGRQGMHFENWSLPQNVIVTGALEQPELDRLLAAADVALNPMASGGGTNLKLIEYFANGIPVVSTPLGARGTAVRDREELVLSPLESFPVAIRSVLADRESSDWRAGQARALAELGYDWGPIATAFATAVEAALAPHA